MGSRHARACLAEEENDLQEEYHTSRNSYAFVELKFEDSVSAQGVDVEAAFVAGFRYNFDHRFQVEGGSRARTGGR